jgi:hypothetical protein
MAQWKKVLISGSHFSVKELTISDIGSAGANDTILFAGSASVADSGSFKTKSGLRFDGNTTLEFDGGSFGAADAGTFIGDGSGLTDVPATAGEGIKAGAGTYILLNSNGSNSSPFTGNLAAGENLTVRLRNSNLAGYGNSENATHTATDINNFNSGVDGGVIFRIGETLGPARLGLDSASLADRGLTWDDNFYKLKIDLNEASDGDTTFDLDSNGLKLANAFAGDGLQLNSGVVNFDFATNSGLALNSLAGSGTSLGIHLANTLDGNGLLYKLNNNNHSVLNIDGSTIVTSSAYIKINSEGPAAFVNPFLNSIRNQFSNHGGVIYVNGVYTDSDVSGTPDIKQDWIDDPIYTFSLQTTWGADNDPIPGYSSIEFLNNVTIGGSLTIISSSNVTSIHADSFSTSDPIVLLNSGSAIENDIFEKNGGIIVQTTNSNYEASGSAVFFASASNAQQKSAWGLAPETEAVSWDATTLPGRNATEGGYVDSNLTLISLIKASPFADPNAAYESSPILSVADDAYEKRGTWYIDMNTEPAGGESNIWVCLEDDDFPNP